MLKKIIVLVISTAMILANVAPVSAEIEKTGSITRGGSGILNGHYVKTTFDWVLNNKKTKVKRSTASQSAKGAYVTSYNVNKKKALSSEKKHVYYVNTEFTIELVIAWGSVAITKESYTDKVTLNANGSADVEWGI